MQQLLPHNAVIAVVVLGTANRAIFAISQPDHLRKRLVIKDTARQFNNGLFSLATNDRIEIGDAFQQLFICGSRQNPANCYVYVRTRLFDDFGDF